MKIVFLTPGTGAWFCGACMRDNALANSLQAAGHGVSVLPMYLPHVLDEDAPASSCGAPMFFGGINVYLQQKHSIFRRTPDWFDKLLDHPALLRRVAERSHMTSAREQGEMTHAMLRVEESRFGKELEKLVSWLERESPDILCLSTALQAGLICELKHRLSIPILCFFQGEDGFLDSLPDPWRDACWSELAKRVRKADLLVSPSRSYADLMRARLGPQTPDITVLPNGINMDGHQPSRPKSGPPVIGYLARMCREKGLEVMVDAFIHLRNELRHPDARLHLAGAATSENRDLIDDLKSRIAAAGLAEDVSWSENISRAEKVEMLSGLSLFSVPAIHQEAFGLYVIEAMASGVPVVQPAAASFPEIMEKAGAGVLVAPGDPAALARAWHDLLHQPDELARMAKQSREAAEQFFDVRVMRDGFLALARDMI